MTSNDAFYYGEGILALAATVLYIFHMSRKWNSIETWGQRLRYFCLLYFAVLITYVSTQQIHHDQPINVQGLASVVGAFLLIVTAGVSIHEDRRRRKAGLDRWGS